MLFEIHQRYSSDWEGSLIAWRRGEDPNPLYARKGWAPGESKIQYCKQEDLDSMEYLGTEDGVETYRNRETGEKVYVGRTKSNADQLFDEAIEIIKPFIEIAGRDLGETPKAERVGALTRGAEMLETVLETNPDSWVAWWQLGKARQALAQSEASYDAFARAYGLEKENPNVAREFMKECLELGRVEEAVEAAAHAMHQAPEDDGLVSNYALALLFAGRNKEALQTAKRAKKMAKDPITDNLIGMIKDVIKGRREAPRCFSDL